MSASLRRVSSVLVPFVLAFGLGACKTEKGTPENKVVEGAKKMGEGIAEGAKAAWQATKEGAQYVGTKVAEGAKVAAEKVAAAGKAVANEASDVWITGKIKGKLGLDRLMNVSVDTMGGRVTLTGRVKDEAERSEVEKLARETDGVKLVINKLGVGFTGVTAPAVPSPAPVAPPPVK